MQRIAKENGIQGRVVLQFAINTDGSVRDIKVLGGIDSALDREAVRKAADLTHYAVAAVLDIVAAYEKLPEIKSG